VLATLVIAAVGMLAAARLSSGRRELLMAVTDLRTTSSAITARQDEVARAGLARAAARLSRANAAAHAFPLGLLGVVPVVGSPGRALAAAVDAGEQGVTASRLLVEAGSSFPTSGTAGLDGHDLGALHTAAVRSQKALDQAAQHALRAESTLKGPAGALLPQVSSPARAMLAELREGRRRIEGAQRGLALLGDLTAPQTETRLLLLSQDSLELRPTGGYIGSYGVIRLSGGTVQLEKYEATEDMPPPEPPMPTPRDLMPYLGRYPWRLSNVNWWPDFPTSARAAQEMFRRQGGGEVDGVVAITEHLLIRILSAIGPLKLPSYAQPVVAEGFDDRVVYEVELKRPLDTPRKRFLIELADVLVGRLFDLPGQQLPAVVGALDQAVGAGDVQMWFANPVQQARIRGAVIAGELPRPSGDFLMVVDANMTASKANAGVVKQASYRVRRDDDGRLLSRLEVRVRDDGPPTRINPFYNSFLRVYVPQGSTLLGERPDQGQEESLAPDGPFEVFAQVLQVQPQSEQTVVFDYQLPGDLTTGRRHRVTWFRQVGTPRDILRATVGITSGQMAPGLRTLLVDGSPGDEIPAENEVVTWLRSRWLFEKLGL